MDTKRVILQGTAVPVRGNDIDTDRIIPARFLKTVTFDGLGEHAFEDDRLALKEEGKTHSFDQPQFQGAKVLLVNKNFGCGSSREHAPQAIARWNEGISVIVGESFAEIFYGNCQALGVPCPRVSAEAIEKLMKAVQEDPAAEVTVDLQNKTVSVKDVEFPIDIPEGPRQAFLEGSWDSTAALLDGKEDVKKTAAQLPYMNGFSS